MKNLFLLIPFVALGAPAFSQTSETGFCIANASDVPHFFITETREGVRQIEKVEPGGKLCADKTAAADGIVSVFESLDSLEGCSRIIARGVTEELIEYAEFDRCEWSSHRS